MNVEPFLCQIYVRIGCRWIYEFFLNSCVRFDILKLNIIEYIKAFLRTTKEFSNSNKGYWIIELYSYLVSSILLVLRYFSYALQFPCCWWGCPSTRIFVNYSNHHCVSTLLLLRHRFYSLRVQVFAILSKSEFCHIIDWNLLICKAIMLLIFLDYKYPRLNSGYKKLPKWPDPRLLLL